MGRCVRLSRIAQISKRSRAFGKVTGRPTNARPDSRAAEGRTATPLPSASNTKEEALGQSAFQHDPGTAPDSRHAPSNISRDGTGRANQLETGVMKRSLFQLALSN